MDIAVVVLLIVVLLVALSIIRPTGGFLADPEPLDRDATRRAADLAALRTPRPAGQPAGPSARRPPLR